MPALDSNPAALFWHRRASLLAWKLNGHHFLARLVPYLFAVLVIQSIFELVRREAGGPVRWSWALLFFGVSAAMIRAGLAARRHFCTSGQALVRYETVLGLHNRLSAAEAGVIAWPAPPAVIHDGYAPNWKLLVAPVLAGMLFLAAAHLIPVSSLKLSGHGSAISEPPGFAQVQSWINALKTENLIEPEKLQEMQTALDKLRDRPPQDWYKQSDLEAANSLKELMEQSMNALSHDLDQADKAVEAMQKQAENPSSGMGLQPMQDALRKAGENLASGALPLNRELSAQLSGAEKAMDKSLSAAQLKALHEQLQKGALAARTAPKTNGGLSDEMKQAMDAAKGMNGKGRGNRHVAVPGPGGEGGGEETAPLELQARDQETSPGPMTAVKTDDMSRAALGETLKVSSGKHEVNPADYQGLQSAGAAQVQGTSGEAVWRSTYDPQEADTLQRFFK